MKDITREKLLEQRQLVEDAQQKHMEELQKFHQMEYDFLKSRYEQWTKENTILLDAD